MIIIDMYIYIYRCEDCGIKIVDSKCHLNAIALFFTMLTDGHISPGHQRATVGPWDPKGP